MASNEIEQLASDFAASFTKFSDLEGAIIRGHILIEQSINRSIELTILNKKEYNPNRFSFSQKMVIANMLGITTNYKTELNILNILRNQIAHSLVFDEDQIDTIITEVKKKNLKIFEGKDSKASSLIAAIAFVCGGISSIHLDAAIRSLLHLLAHTKREFENNGLISLDNNSTISYNQLLFALQKLSTPAP